MYDVSLGVLLMMYKPRVKKLGYVEDMVSNIDVHKQYFIEHLWDTTAIPSSEVVRTAEWKYFRYRFIKAPEYLYNLKSDTMESINLATDPKYKKILENIRQECDAQLKNTRKRNLIHSNLPKISSILPEGLGALK